MWRLITYEPQVASLQEIETHYSLDDVLKANAVLDYKEELRRKASKKG